ETTDGVQCEGVCVSPVPDGWTGPVALWTDDPGGSAPACLGAYPQNAGSFFADLDPGEATCDCDCTDATGIACTTAASLCYNNGTLQGCTLPCFEPPSIAP